MAPDHHHALNERRLFWSAALTGLFMLAEAAGGIISGSLALLADAGHMMADFAGLALAWLAFRLSRRPADRRRTYGFERMQILVAFGNGLFLFFVAVAIVVEAVRRLAAPVEVLGGTMLLVALAGLVVNLGILVFLHGADRENLNVRGALLHVVGDLLGSGAAVLAALIILATGWMAADPLLSVLVAVIILRSAWAIIRDSAHILLEGTPAGIDTAEIEADLEAAIGAVIDVHHVHAWSITQERTMVTLHARIDPDSSGEAAVAAIKARLRDRFRIEHATVEIERERCADETPRPAQAGHGTHPQPHRHHHPPGHRH